MKSLFEDGVIYMNTLEFYRTLEGHDERHDLNEGVERILNLRGGVLKLRNRETYEFKEVAQLTHSRVRELNSNFQNLNVFCSYYFKSDMPIVNLGKTIPEKVKLGFGKYAVVVFDAAEFVTRVKQAAIEKGYKHYRSLVEYKDFSQNHIDVGPFVKDEVFSHQNELRIAVDTIENNGSSIKLHVGNLEDIAVLLRADLLDRMSITEQLDSK